MGTRSIRSRWLPLHCVLLASLAAGVVVGPSAVVAAEPEVTGRLLDVRMIWDKAPHNAFTDLVRWRGEWYCGFREGQGHAGDLGKIRIIRSSDGQQWKSVGLIEMPKFDVRDAALSVTPDDRLMVLGGNQNMVDGTRTTGTFVSFSDDGQTFTEPQLVTPHGRWLWRVTWHGDKAYGVSYATPRNHPHSSLLVTENGTEYQKLVPELLSAGWPTEARVRFGNDGTGYCLHRRDGSSNSAYWGTAKPPYTQWQWTDLKRYVGGPNFLQVPSGHWIGVGRLVDGASHTEVFQIPPDSPSVVPLLRLPSGGDTSYPGLVWHDEVLWVSYYSSHEDSTKIYLARVAIE